jgi:predicted secreted protein
MRARAIIVIIYLALAAASPASMASDIPLDLAGLSSFGFPSSLLQSSFSGLPPGYLLPSSTFSNPDSMLSLTNAFMTASPGSMAGYSSFFPETSSLGFPATSNLSVFGSPSFSSSQMSFPETSGMLGQPFQGLASQANTGFSPSTENNYTEASNGKTIKIKVGDIIHVQLDSRVDLGYLWNLNVTDGLNVTVNRIYPPQQLAANIGAGTIKLLSTQEWDIKAIMPGTQVINATYSRSKPGPDDRTFILTVIVE